MIAHLSGIVIHKFKDHVILQAGSVGYEVFLPESKILALPPHREIQLFIHTHIREDSFELFGFTTLDEKQLFRLLINVSGIGPKLGLAILNTVDVRTLVDSILIGKIHILTKIPGIGTRTAERIVLELKNKPAIRSFVTGSSNVGATTFTDSNSESRISSSSSDPAKPSVASHFDDAVKALVILGYKDTEAMSALRATLSYEGMDLSETIKLALKELSG